MIRSNKGFSLVELIVVIAIMAIMVGMLAPSVIGQVEKSREAKDKQNLETFSSAVAASVSDDLTSSLAAVSPVNYTFPVSGKISSTDAALSSQHWYQQAMANIGSDIALHSNAYKDSPISLEINSNFKITVSCPALAGSSADSISIIK